MSKIKEFLKLEASGGIVLFLAAVLAVVCENTLLKPYYDLFLDTPVEVRVGALEIAKPLILWIDDGLMAIFFLLIGLEVKREFLDGELSSWSQIALPGIAAVGGMAGPALCFYYFNSDNPEFLRGWAIPTATDIAFALGVLSLFGSRIPVAAKIFLMALAIFDDLGAIIIIALFYTSDLSWVSLALSGVCLIALVVLNRKGVTSITPYALIGICLWVCVLKSGVHATLAGVALALSIPFTGKEGEKSPLLELEHALHPWVAFAVLPLFAFGNAGIDLRGMSLSFLSEPLSLGVISGLIVGKLVGVFGCSFIAIKLGIGKLPEGVNWGMLLGISFLTGIGFTMSLFIGGLAFAVPEQLEAVRLAIVFASLLAGIAGVLVVHFSAAKEAD